MKIPAAVQVFEESLTGSERRILTRLNTPARIQHFIDTLPYRAADTYLCPLSVLRKREAHCFDGALFAAAALRRLGHPPQLVYMTAYNDDDHLLAPFRINGHWGAIGKSNFVGLRFREPIHRNLRELIISYFEQYYNVKRQKTLRAYTVPLRLERFDGFDWMISDRHLDRVAAQLDHLRTIPLLTRRMITGLSRVDKRSHRAGLVGSRKAGLYKPT